MEPLPIDPVYNCAVCPRREEEEIGAHPHIVHRALAALHVLLCTERRSMLATLHSCTPSLRRVHLARRVHERPGVGQAAAAWVRV